jgi:hypothetical protein
MRFDTIDASLQRGGKTYAQRLTGRYQNASLAIIDHLVIARDRYLGREAQCLLEITNASLVPRKADNFRPEKGEVHLLGTLIGVEPAYRFFPSLISLVEAEDDFDADEYADQSAILFAEYGDFGFGRKPYDAFPLFQINAEVFILNPFLFEEITSESDNFGKQYFIHMEEATLVNIQETKNPEPKPAPVSKGYFLTFLD